MDELLTIFLAETNENILDLEIQLKNLEQSPEDKETLFHVFRIMHTLKGSSRFLKLPRLEAMAHETENLLGAFRDGKKEATNEYLAPIYETLETIKDIITFIEVKGREPKGEDSELKDRLRRAYESYDDPIIKNPELSLGNVWARLSNMVKEISHELEKEIVLDVHGEDLILSEPIFELIKDPIMHMVRNAVDHGIERPQDRIKAGKPQCGTIKVNVYKDNQDIVIEISDDGEGLSAYKIKNKLIETGIQSEDEVNMLSDKQLQQFIFTPGFSTASKITSVSGRGVGMDIVYNNIKKIGGQVELFSEEGSGITVVVRIPDKPNILSTAP